MYFSRISRASKSSMNRIPKVSTTIIHILIDVMFRTTILVNTAVFLNPYVWIFLIKIEKVLQSIKESLPNRLLRLMWNSWWLIIVICGCPGIVMNCCFHRVVLVNHEILTTHFMGVEQAGTSLHKSARLVVEDLSTHCTTTAFP